jgi:hypothetical protein
LKQEYGSEKHCRLRPLLPVTRLNICPKIPEELNVSNIGSNSEGQQNNKE